MSDQEEMVNRIKEICLKNRYLLRDAEAEKLNAFVSEILNWNKKINLISRKDENQIWERHILGSIAFLFKFRLEAGARLMDAGTGGGFPGLPIAVLNPEIDCVLVDSIKKKINALSDIIKKLDLKNAIAVCGRVEDLMKEKKYSRSFDYVVARAVAPAIDIVKWARHGLKTDTRNDEKTETDGNERVPLRSGSMILLKGGNVDTEIEEVKKETKPRSVGIHPIVIEDAGEGLLDDKKIIVIQF